MEKSQKSKPKSDGYECLWREDNSVVILAAYHNDRTYFVPKEESPREAAKAVGNLTALPSIDRLSLLMQELFVSKWYGTDWACWCRAVAPGFKVLNVGKPNAVHLTFATKQHARLFKLRWQQ